MPRSATPQTLSREITISGRGLHGNRPCTVRLVPVTAPSGLVFVHLPTGTEIPAKAELAGDLVLATTLVKDGVRLQTVEHLLSALMGLEVEHLRIEVDAEELPILDGSAAPWVDAILRAGSQALEGRRRFLKITQPIEVRNGDRWIRALPFDGFRLRYEDEAVRHKMLDLVGDLALLGAPLLGLVEAHAAGHALHVALSQAILANPACWEWTEDAKPTNVRRFFQPLVAQPA